MTGHDLAQNVFVILARLLLAVVLGAVLGLERERRERPAGLRTHILVTLTACLAVMVGLGCASAPTAPAASPRACSPASAFSARGPSCGMGTLSAA